MNFMQVGENRMKEYCEGLVSVFQERYEGWEGAKQFSGTPDRLVRMYDDFCWPPERISSELDKAFGRTFKHSYKETLVVKPIDVWTLCPHHFLPCRFNVSIGYAPDGFVLGLSKFARIADALSRRPVMQEEYSDELANLLMERLQPRGVAVYIIGQHGCMITRGVRQSSSVVTSVVKGIFEEPAYRAEFLALCRSNHEHSV